MTEVSANEYCRTFNCRAAGCVGEARSAHSYCEDCQRGPVVPDGLAGRAACERDGIVVIPLRPHEAQLVRRAVKELVERDARPTVSVLAENIVGMLERPLSLDGLPQIANALAISSASATEESRRVP